MAHFSTPLSYISHRDPISTPPFSIFLLQPQERQQPQQKEGNSHNEAPFTLIKPLSDRKKTYSLPNYKRHTRTLISFLILQTERARVSDGSEEGLGKKITMIGVVA